MSYRMTIYIKGNYTNDTQPFKIRFYFGFAYAVFWLTDEKSQLNFTLNGTVYALSIPEAAIGLFVFFLLAELLFLSFRATVTLLKNDVLLSNHSFQNDKESIENTQTGNEDKIVLSRNQFDEAAILIVRTMGAVTAGLMNEARRLLVSLRKLSAMMPLSIFSCSRFIKEKKISTRWNSFHKSLCRMKIYN